MTPIILKYNPQRHQTEFHRSAAKFRALFGGYGNGKTTAFCAEGHQLSLEYPGNFGLIGRMTYPELRDSTWHEYINFPVIVEGKEMPIKDSPLIKAYNKAEHSLEYVNGSLVVGRALEGSFDKVKSMNLGWFGIDQVEECPEEMWLGLVGRLRRKGVRHTAFGVGNPEGHNWVWKRWVMGPDQDHFIVNAPSDANKYLPAGYVDSLIKLYPEEWVKRYVYGSFDTFEGLVYKEFQDKEPFVLPNDTKIPEHWYRFVGMDHGYRNPTAVLWCAVAPTGEVYVYDEFFSSGKLVSEIAQIIKTKDKDVHSRLVLIDPSCRNRNGVTGRSVIDEFMDYGIACTPANNDVRAGINHVQEMLKLKNGQPQLRILRNCVNLRTEFQTYRWKDLKPGATQNSLEKPVKKDDHAIDACRYLLNYIYDTPNLTKKKNKFDYKAVLARFKGAEAEHHWMAA